MKLFSKSFFSLSLIVFTLNPITGYADKLYETLITPTYIIQVKPPYADRNHPQPIHYKIINKKTNTSQELVGKAIISQCSEEKGCDFLSYTFKDSPKNYFLYEDNAAIDIIENNKVILTEKGDWFYTTENVELPSNQKKQCWAIESPQDEMTFYSDACFYSKQVYEKLRLDGLHSKTETQFLAHVLPDKNSQLPIKASDKLTQAPSEISYYWRNKNELYLAFYYPGGLTTYVLKQRHNGTALLQISYPD